MTFDEVLDQVRELLRQRGRVTYRSLKLRYQLDDELLAGATDELIKAERVATDENGEVLVWIGEPQEQGAESTERGVRHEEEERSQTQLASLALRSLLPASRAEGERRQLTVMFCDLVGSTALSAQLDPEELREVVQAYQETSTAVIQRYAGHIAQHLGDGLLVYFGYPVAHEDDATRAVRAGLEILANLQPLNARLPSMLRARLPHPMQVRIGIHTGLVVIGEIGSSAKREVLALGETPNLAARIQGQANPDEVIISAATHRLVAGLFMCEDQGQPELKGVATPLTLYRIVKESEAHSRFDVAEQAGLTPLVGRDEELGLLKRRWEQAKGGEGQIVLLSGEPGIGKSRLVQTLKEQVLTEGATRLEFRCSPYHQNSAFYPILEHLQRFLQLQREESPPAKLDKLAQSLSRYRFPQADTLPLLAALLSLPHPEDRPPLTLSPQKQKQKTQDTLVAWLVEEADTAAMYCAWEDLHWADPSTLDVLTLLLDQVPTSRLLTVLTFRPEFTSPWGNRSHLSQLTLSRLGRSQVESMVENVTGGKSLPSEVLRQIVTKTDGVPLFVEELTKTVLESGLLTAIDDHYELRGPLPLLAIPSTLQDSLMARLDRLSMVREIAQLGATLGREFSYELLRAVSPLDEERLQQGLKQLVEAELVYQRGQVPHAHYLFKHALIQDTAYQSLLKSTRQHYHTKIAQVLTERFPETVESQPELLAHHYTEAGLIEQALPYWLKAGERASQRSSYVEAINHLTKGLEVLNTLPDTSERARQELTLHLALNDALVTIKGYTAPEVEKTVLRARDLCRQAEETPQLFPVLGKLWLFYLNRGELQTARELAEQMMRLAQSAQDLFALSVAHEVLGCTLYWLGELTSARTYLEQAIALYDPQKHPRTTIAAIDLRVNCLSYASWALWRLGYPDQGLKKSREALALAEGLSHLFSLAYALGHAAWLHLLRREEQIAREQAEAEIGLSTEQGFSSRLVIGTIFRGGALAEQGQVEEGIAQMQQGLAAFRVMGAELPRMGLLPLLAVAYAKMGQVKEGLDLLAEALAFVDKNGLRFSEAELYRLKGELTFQQLKMKNEELKITKAESPNPQPPTPNTQHPSGSGARSREVFSQSHRDCPKTTSQIAGTASGDEFEPIVAEPGQEERSSPNVVRDLRLVLRRV